MANVRRARPKRGTEGATQVTATRDCQHGQLARSCDRCADAAEIAELRAEVEALTAVARSAALLSEWIGETPHVRGSINGQAAQLGHAAREALEKQ